MPSTSLRGNTNEDDVARAVRFLKMKLAFLSLNAPKTGGDHFGMSLDQFLVQRLGTEVVTAEIAEAYKVASGLGACERTVRRAVQRLGGVKLAKGRYLLPPKK